MYISTIYSVTTYIVYSSKYYVIEKVQIVSLVQNYLKKQSMKTYKHIAPRVIRVTMRNNAKNLV